MSDLDDDMKAEEDGEGGGKEGFDVHESASGKGGHRGVSFNTLRLLLW